MNISFRKLQKEDFPLILKWLMVAHVRKWWDPDINWNLDKIEEKYQYYVEGFKLLRLKDKTIKKPMHAYIIQLDDKDIGYIQYYDKHDFPPEQGYDVNEIPDKCAAIDWYIGEVEFTGKGIGPESLEVFIKNIIDKKFKYLFVDPETDNEIAIKSYKKSGFEIIKTIPISKITWMIRRIN